MPHFPPLQMRNNNAFWSQRVARCPKGFVILKCPAQDCQQLQAEKSPPPLLRDTLVQCLEQAWCMSRSSYAPLKTHVNVTHAPSHLAPYLWEYLHCILTPVSLILLRTICMFWAWLIISVLSRIPPPPHKGLFLMLHLRQPQCKYQLWYILLPYNEREGASSLVTIGQKHWYIRKGHNFGLCHAFLHAYLGSNLAHGCYSQACTLHWS